MAIYQLPHGVSWRIFASCILGLMLVSRVFAQGPNLQIDANVMAPVPEQSAGGGAGYPLPEVMGLAAGNGDSRLQFKVQGATQKLEMIVNSSRILTVDHPVPQAQVNNPDLVKLTPLSPNQLQIFAIKPGVTQVNLWDDRKGVHSIDVVVYGDARELQMLINTQFPTANVRVIPLASSVLINGTVPRAEMVSRITRIAEDFYGKVVNNMQVEGVQTVLLHVKVMEVSRTKLRRLGFDFANINGDDFVISGVSGLISKAATQAGTATGNGDTIRFGIVDGSNSFFGFLEALRRNNMVKILAEPTLVTISGRPASFNAGGEFPILIPSGLGTTSIQFKEFGTRVDFVPIVLGNGNIRLETRPQVSEVDEARGVTINNITVPGLRSRWVDTAVEMRAGQTLALAGLIQQRTESEVAAVPWLGELPWIGAAFRRTQETMNEIELLIMVRPELVDALDPHEVPPCGPGELTTSPSDTDLFYRAYNEVPKCCNDGSCPQCRSRASAYSQPHQPYGQPMPATVAPAGHGAAMPRQPMGAYSSNRGPAPSANGGVQVRPVAGPTQPRIQNNPYGGNNPAPVVVAPDGRGEPEYFGPRGYDVIDYKKK